MTGITVVANFVDLSSTAPILATMIGLAVGIDYALFIVTRHRQNLAEGFSVEESAARANATAGGAVVFAGMTVVIALAGLCRRRHPVPHRDGPRRRRHRARGDRHRHHADPGAARLRRPQHRPLADRPGPHRLARRVGPHAQRPLGPPRDRAAGRRARRRTRRDAAARRPAALDAHRDDRRRHQPAVDDPAPGLRPARRRLRARLQRSAAGRRRPRGQPPTPRPRCRRSPSTHRRRPRRAGGRRAGRQPRRGDTAVIPVVPRSGPSSAETEDLVHRPARRRRPGLEARRAPRSARRRRDRGADRHGRQDGRAPCRCSCCSSSG